ncbi:lysophospholipid acyltransferase family protein [Thiomicrorhabdus arctica]|uniref:lysophospholipid acyltransferase family protein n=1 Tax=Thiomicrorhabdus arctica TaxID=131540 RepID=UPI00037FD3CC|nr:lysophospholipid acyltransferase family protein [Thiomicrorhabdus arctica]
MSHLKHQLPEKKPAKKRTVNDQAWLGALLKGLVIAFSWFSLAWNQRLGRGIGWLLIWLPNSQKSIARKNLQVVYPDLRPDEQKVLLHNTLFELGKTITELGPMWCWPNQQILPLIKEIKGQALLDEAITNQKGVIFLGPHIGNWELNAIYLASRYPSTFLYRPPNVSSVESFMKKARSRFGGKLVPTDLRGVRTLIKALKNNEVTGILPDQDPGESGGVYAPFFGRPARSMTFVSKLVQKTDCAVLFMMMERLPNAEGYRLHFLPTDADIGSTDELVATTALNAGIEACIALAPEQYLWSYKRFRHPPAGVVDIYKS